MNVRIIRRPIGEAPEWVRDAWIGLTLPTSETSSRKWWGFGVVTGPSNAFLQIIDLLLGRALQVNGYPVDAKTAVEVLAASNPSAATWWIENAPALVSGSRKFVFDTDACDLID